MKAPLSAERDEFLREGPHEFGLLASRDDVTAVTVRQEKAARHVPLEGKPMRRASVELSSMNLVPHGCRSLMS